MMGIIFYIGFVLYEIDMESCTEIVLHMVNKESHIPIPTRVADIDTHNMRSLYK